MPRQFPTDTRVTEWMNEQTGVVVGYADAWTVQLRLDDGTVINADVEDCERVGPPVATDIYERLTMSAEGAPGSVATDLRDLTYQEMEDYFMDSDPTEYL